MLLEIGNNKMETNNQIKLVFETGENAQVDITHKIDDFFISYQAMAFKNETPLEKITNIKAVLQEINNIAKELEVVPTKFIVEFQYPFGRAFCAVDKNHVLLLSIVTS